MTYARMADAAFAANIPPGFDIAGGYYGGPAEFHQWLPGDWQRFPGFRLPIWVGGLAGEADGDHAAEALAQLGVPPGSLTVLDMEGRVDITYVTAFGLQLHAAGYKVWVYGQASTVFGNPPLNGYWVANFGADLVEIDALLAHEHGRAVQYANGPGYDSSVVKPWTEGEMWHG